MNNFDVLLSVTSWEDRFEKGIRRFLTQNSVNEIILFDYEDYKKETEYNTKNLQSLLEQKGIQNIIVSLKHNKPIYNWKQITSTIVDISGSVVVDISTMPRDIIYYILFLANNKNNSVSNLFFLYNSPKSYSNEEWLTRDPSAPQLIYNMSGIFEMGKDNVLIIITGFDKKRVEQLLNYYETRKTYLCLQTGDQYENNRLNADKYQKSYASLHKFECIDINNYENADFGFKVLEEIIIKEQDCSNIVIASLGPKPSSLAVYRLWHKYPNIGILYVPVRTYNIRYSSGISENEPIFEKLK